MIFKRSITDFNLFLQSGTSARSTPRPVIGDLKLFCGFTLYEFLDAINPALPPPPLPAQSCNHGSLFGIVAEGNLVYFLLSFLHLPVTINSSPQGIPWDTGVMKFFSFGFWRSSITIREVFEETKKIGFLETMVDVSSLLPTRSSGMASTTLLLERVTDCISDFREHRRESLRDFLGDAPRTKEKLHGRVRCFFGQNMRCEASHWSAQKEKHD
ncbi:hypothetical protein VNO80_25149 [Phaseolus coccineus]|uniref:Uncharacterized protein n=1 Tax=Phaseolus coccineus TaxID=3886 RepID=A0AAN9LTR3_PHACN